MLNYTKTIDSVLRMPRRHKRMIALTADFLICVISVYLSFYLRLGTLSPILGIPVFPALVCLGISIPLFVSFGLYRAIFRYTDSHAVLAIARAVGFYSIPFAIIYTFYGVDGVPRTIGLIQPVLLFLLVATSRLIARSLFGTSYLRARNDAELTRVLIYGAGSAGRQLASAIRTSHEMLLFGFIDDDPDLHRSTLNGMPIVSLDELPRQVHRFEISDVLLAIPSATRARRTEIARQVKELGLHVRTLPSVIDLARGSISISDLKELEIDDLLGRKPVPPNFDLIRHRVADRVVLVTGAGGSIGSEICRQILAQSPAVLLLVELSEYNLYQIHQELITLGATLNSRTLVTPLLASVHDERRIGEIIALWRPSTIFHAAAYKHVPLIEHNPIEGIRNNVFGTLTVARAALRHQVGNFVLISTDKAVRPTNIMGTTKRLAEMILQALHAEGGETCFSMVRFGNVLGSSGSVVPLFRRQIAAGGPVTITHPEITRYFMTIPEAAQLVLQAGAMAKGGEVFVLDMGEPVRIFDLARNMIELSGLTVRDGETSDGDIEIRFVGLRPGEKLYEELLIGDNSTHTSHPRILRAQECFMAPEKFFPMLDELLLAINGGDVLGSRKILLTIVPEFSPTSDLVDFVTGQRKLHANLPAELNKYAPR